MTLQIVGKHYCILLYPQPQWPPGQISASSKATQLGKFSQMRIYVNKELSRIELDWSGIHSDILRNFFSSAGARSRAHSRIIDIVHNMKLLFPHKNNAYVFDALGFTLCLGNKKKP